MLNINVINCENTLPNENAPEAGESPKTQSFLNYLDQNYRNFEEEKQKLT